MLRHEGPLELLARKQQEQRGKNSGKLDPPPPLPFVNMSTWDSEPVPQQHPPGAVCDLGRTRENTRDLYAAWLCRSWRFDELMEPTRWT